MRSLIPILITIISSVIFCCCDKEEDSFTAKGYVIGFDPCKKGAPIVPEDSIRGLLVEIPDKNVDTLLTYNIPWTLFDFPNELFIDYQVYYYFPEAYRRAYNLNFTYRYAKPDERQGYVCSGAIFAPGFERFPEKQIIILSAEKISN